jgi:hypothetical protein
MSKSGKNGFFSQPRAAISARGWLKVIIILPLKIHIF